MLIEQSILPAAFKNELLEYLLKTAAGESIKEAVSLREAAYQLGIKNSHEVYYVFIDRLSGAVLLRSGAELHNQGLCVELPPHTTNLFMMHEITDQQQELRFMSKRSQGNVLTLEDIYILMQKFGVGLTYKVIWVCYFA